MFSRVITTEILKLGAPASASRSSARIAGFERACATDCVVHIGGRSIERDLDVDVVVGRDAGGGLLGDPGSVGRELDADIVRRRVVEDLPEIAANSGLAASDVDVEDQHRLELVDHAEALGRRELARIAAPRARQAMAETVLCSG
jgi:hypothetical protein